MTAPLAPEAAIRRAGELLREAGFVEVARGARAGSLYLAGPDGGQIRVASHRRTPKRRRQYPQVMTSVVIDGPVSEAVLRERIATALRDYAGRRSGGGHDA
ncbi:MAG: hypothetical protein PGN34_22275 [Methylobacterium frigidaeris]